MFCWKSLFFVLFIEEGFLFFLFPFYRFLFMESNLKNKKTNQKRKRAYLQVYDRVGEALSASVQLPAVM